MKKLFALLISVAILFCSCNSNLPDGVNKAVYDIGVQTIDTVDKYFAGTLSRTDAQKQMEDLCNAYFEDKSTQKSETNISPYMEVITSYLLLEQDESNIVKVNRVINDKRNDIARYLEVAYTEGFPEIVQEQ